MSDKEMITTTVEEIKELVTDKEQVAEIVELHETDVLNTFGNTSDFEAVQRFAKALSKSDVVPEAYRDNIPNCMVAIDMANRMGLTPFMVMQNLYIVKGKPSWSGQACRALIENDGRYTNITTVYIGEKGTDGWGCYLQAETKSTGKLVKGPTVDIAMAKKEGWYSKKDKYGNETSKWQSMPELMLAYRAAAFFARVYCPSAMMGFQTVEEVTDIANAEKLRKTNNITSDILGGT